MHVQNSQGAGRICDRELSGFLSLKVSFYADGFEFSDFSSHRTPALMFSVDWNPFRDGHAARRDVVWVASGLFPDW